MNGFDDPISRRIIPEGEGVVLLNRFKLLRYVGAGSVGVVYEAFDSNRSERVAIKVFYPVLVNSLETREKLLTTAILNSKLDFPGVVQVHETYQGNGLFWYSMEWIEAGSLREYFAQRQQEKNPIPIEEAVGIVGRLVDILANVSATTVHLAIKPENIFHKSGGDIVVSDFGFQSCLERSRASFSCLVTSSVAYQAAEVLKEDGKAGARADQFSVAAIFYEMLTGAPPLGLSDSIHLLRKGLPKAMEPVVNRALSPIAEDRFETLRVFREALDRSREYPRWIRPLLQAVGVLLVGYIAWFLLAAALPDSTIAKTFQTVFDERDNTRISSEATALWNQAAIQMFQNDRVNEDVLGILANEEMKGELEFPPGTRVPFPFEETRQLAATIWKQSDRERVSATLTLARRDLDQGRFEDVIDPVQAVATSTAQVLTNLELLKRYLRLTIQVRRDSVELARLQSSRGPIERWLSLIAKSAPLSQSSLSDRSLDAYAGFLEETRDEANRILEEAEGRALRMKGRFVSLLGSHITPPLHIGDPVGLLADAQSMSLTPVRWRDRFDAYTEAAELWERWSDEFQSLPVPSEMEVRENSLHMRFVPLKPDLWVSIYETRLIDLETFVQSSGYDTDRHWRWLHDEFKQQSPFEPAVNMKLDLVTDFCIWLTDYERERGLISGKDHYRLPTIEEWESASQFVSGRGNRAGIEDGFEFTAPVGRFPPNRLGLYDIDGNVAEWCLGGIEAGMPSMYYGYVPGATWHRSVVDTGLTNGQPATYHLSRDLGFRVFLELAKEGRDD